MNYWCGTPIGFVKNERKEVIDDNWGEVVSENELSEGTIKDALEGIEVFSHLEIIFYMDGVSDEKAIAQYRPPKE